MASPDKTLARDHRPECRNSAKSPDRKRQGDREPMTEAKPNRSGLFRDTHSDWEVPGDWGVPKPVTSSAIPIAPKMKARFEWTLTRKLAAIVLVFGGLAAAGHVNKDNSIKDPSAPVAKTYREPDPVTIGLAVIVMAIDAIFDHTPSLFVTACHNQGGVYMAGAGGDHYCDTSRAITRDNF